MPLPRALARFNLVATNRVLGPLAERLPGFAVLEHVGRRSGRTHRTPVNLFARDGRWVVALTYGRDSQWVRNVVAAGGCTAVVRSRRLRLRDPQIVRDPGRGLVPAPVRPALAPLAVADFMLLRPS